jgi:hypothetical protein
MSPVRILSRMGRQMLANGERSEPPGIRTVCAALKGPKTKRATTESLRTTAMRMKA